MTIFNKSTYEYWTVGRQLGKDEWFLDGSHHPTEGHAERVVNKYNSMLEFAIARGDTEIINPSAKYEVVRVITTREIHGR